MASYSATADVLLLACFLLPFCAAQASCRGRCGEPFTRGRICHCDYNCLVHNECCDDFESKCTRDGSCIGRCGEAFKRGRSCDCDPNCALYNQCCPDYQNQCEPGATNQNPVMKPDVKLMMSTPRPPISESEELYPALTIDMTSTFSPTFHHTENHAADMHATPMEAQPSLLHPKSTDEHGSTKTSAYESLPSGTAHLLDTAVPVATPDRVSTQHLSPIPPAVAVIVSNGDQQEVQSTPRVDHLGSDTVASSSRKPVTVSLELVSGSRPAGSSTRPNTPIDVANVLVSGGPDSSLTNGETELCSEKPINGVTILLNGTMVVFRGHFFWTLDNNWNPSPARRITEAWGIPSPIDAVFTRTNCQGKTYIFKDNNYWSFENGVMDPGCPKSISVEFNGLSGTIVAALSVPATRRRPETLYFFKNGGLVQKYSYKPATTPNCGKKLPIFTAEQTAEGDSALTLGNEISIKLSWKGFPTIVSAAVSVPNPRKSDGYDYFVFSNDKYYSIKVVGDRLALASTPPRVPQNSARHWMRCF